jgi:hypothetical protein
MRVNSVCVVEDFDDLRNTKSRMSERANRTESGAINVYVGGTALGKTRECFARACTGLNQT